MNQSVNINQHLNIRAVSNGVILSGNFATDGGHEEKVFSFDDLSAESKINTVLDGVQASVTALLTEARDVVSDAFMSSAE